MSFKDTEILCEKGFIKKFLNECGENNAKLILDAEGILEEYYARNGVDGEFVFLQKEKNDNAEEKKEKMKKSSEGQASVTLFEFEQAMHLKEETKNNVNFDELSGTELEIAKVLSEKELSTDDICDLLSLGFGEVASCLTELELMGIIENINGIYRLNQ